jgi:hypothetical protein
LKNGRKRKKKEVFLKMYFVQDTLITNLETLDEVIPKKFLSLHPLKIKNTVGAGNINSSAMP